MNVIRRLKIDLESRNRQLAAMDQGIQDLESYLWSTKFAEDTKVQVADVLLRLREIQNAAANAQVDYENEAYAAERNRAPKPAAYLMFDEDIREYIAVDGKNDILGQSSQRDALAKMLKRQGYRVQA